MSICRALLEEALRGHVKPAELLSEVWKSKKGELESLINVSERTGALNRKLAKQAHAIRKAGNRTLHAKQTNGQSKEDAWAVLLDTRAIVEALCS